MSNLQRKALLSLMIGFTLCSVAHAEEVVKLTDNSTIIGYYISDAPKKYQSLRCTSLAFKNKNFEKVKPGIYHTADNHTFMIDGFCLYPQSGEADLTDGRKVSFYQTQQFESDVPYIGMKRLKAGHYVLKHGDDFDVDKDGMIFSQAGEKTYANGSYHNGRIEYEDRE